MQMFPKCEAKIGCYVFAMAIKVNEQLGYFYIKQHAIKPCCKTSPRLLINPVYACSKSRYLIHVIPRKRVLPEQCSRKSCFVPFLICI